MAQADSGRRDLAVGIFVLVGLAGLAYLSLGIGGSLYPRGGGIQLVAVFDEVGSLKPRAPVVVSGVRVGEVRSIELDADLRARVRFEVGRHLALSTDTSASILTAGLLGDQYISLEPGGEEVNLKSGDQIALTQGAVVVERLIGKLVQNIGSESR